jgi:hypothetical protein
VWGTRQGGRQWRNGEQEGYRLDWKSQPSVNGGAYEQYYRGPLAAMNIIRHDQDKRRDVLQRPQWVYEREMQNIAEGSREHEQFQNDWLRLNATLASFV